MKASTLTPSTRKLLAPLQAPLAALALGIAGFGCAQHETSIQTPEVIENLDGALDVTAAAAEQAERRIPGSLIWSRYVDLATSPTAVEKFPTVRWVNAVSELGDAVGRDPIMVLRDQSWVSEAGRDAVAQLPASADAELTRVYLEAVLRETADALLFKGVRPEGAAGLVYDTHLVRLTLGETPIVTAFAEKIAREVVARARKDGADTAGVLAPNDPRFNGSLRAAYADGSFGWKQGNGTGGQTGNVGATIGNVKSRFGSDYLDRVMARYAPPAPTAPLFAEQLAEVRRQSSEMQGNGLIRKLVTDLDGFEWIRDVVGFLAIENNLTSQQTAQLSALVTAVHSEASIVTWGLKGAYRVVRPYEFAYAEGAPLELPIGPRGHASWVSAHSTLSMATAQVLSAVFPERRDALLSLAEACGKSRVPGALHYPMDVTDGLNVGRDVGQAFVEHASADIAALRASLAAKP